MGRIMISTLRSIDSLFNKFDELSKCHANLLSNFDTNFSDIENPLKNVARTEDEQRKSKENILLNMNKNDEPCESIGLLEDFHRRTIKSRYLHRPPSYSSNDPSLTQRTSSKSNSITAKLASPSKISLITIKEKNSQPVIKTSPKKNIIEPKVDVIKKTKPKVIQHNSSSPRRNERGTAIAFTMETINRLSKPKRYNRLPDLKPLTKRVKQQSKSYENVKKEILKCTILPPIKQTNIKPTLKKLKLEKKIVTQTVKRNPVNNFVRPPVFLTPAPTICIHFPAQPQQKTSRFVNLPKIITTSKRSTMNVKT